MGLLDFLFKKKKVEQSYPKSNISKVSTNDTSAIVKPTNPQPLNSKSVVTINQTVVNYEEFFLNVHPDIRGLLWFGDGVHKNFKYDERVEKYSFNGITCTITTRNEEPSLLFLNQVIEKCEDIFSVEKPDYFPVYKTLTPRQKYVYWKFLSNPYDSRFNIGYAFILYYGLERMMLIPDKFEQAFNVILKMRNTFNNKSFQSYTANTLILMCLKNQRADLVNLFIESLDNEFEFYFNPNLLLLCKYGLILEIKPEELMNIAKDIEFTNLNYIKKYPDLFKEELKSQIEFKFKDGLFLNKILTESVFYNLPKVEGFIFCNSSLPNKISVPNILDNFKVKKVLYDLLEDTHELLKHKLATMRKNGDTPSTIKQEVKEIKVLSFDIETEKALLRQLKDSKDMFAIHFSLMAIQDFYYKFRTLDEKYIDECVKYCEEDLKLCPLLKREWSKEMNGIVGRIPTFERIISIYEKRREYKKILNICDLAIEYYSGSEKHEDLIAKFKRKKDSALKKCHV